MLLADIADGLFEAGETGGAVLLVKREVRLVADRVGSRGVDDGAVEGELRVGLAAEAGGRLADIGVESHAEEAALAEYGVEKLLAVHVLSVFGLASCKSSDFRRNRKDAGWEWRSYFTGDALSGSCFCHCRTK